MRTDSPGYWAFPALGIEPGTEEARGGREMSVPGDVSWGLRFLWGSKSSLAQCLGDYGCSQPPPLPFSLTLKQV